MTPEVTVIGGGLAGCEAAYQLASRGVAVRLIEMKPAALSPAHTTPLLGELVCSNSLRGDDVGTPAGLLKAELRASGSFLMACAERARVPAGGALAVDRHHFSRLITVGLASHPLVQLERRLVDALPDGPTILAGGPLLSGGAGRALRALCGERLYFYDAIAPIVDAETLDWDHCFAGSRYDRGTDVEGDYVNCPMNRDEYYAFVEAVRAGRKVLPHRFEEPRYFEGCLPIEVMAERGIDTLAFGPMKPVGLVDPRRPDNQPFAVVQLRAENRYKTAYNLVGFQTRLAYPEQQRIFAMIPGLRRAEFLRYGSIHRNSYVESHRVLDDRLAFRARPALRLAGQITGVEGYIESTAMGLLAALFLFGELRDRHVPPPPPETALGGLHQHVTRPRAPGEAFVPMNINFGLLPPLAKKPRGGKSARRGVMAQRAREAIVPWCQALGLPGPAGAFVEDADAESAA